MMKDIGGPDRLMGVMAPQVIYTYSTVMITVNSKGKYNGLSSARNLRHFQSLVLYKGHTGDRSGFRGCFTC